MSFRCVRRGCTWAFPSWRELLEHVARKHWGYRAFRVLSRHGGWCPHGGCEGCDR